jgi:hypothetical protein
VLSELKIDPAVFNPNRRGFFIKRADAVTIMKAETVRTVWFSRNSLLAIVVNVPVWGIAGLGWGLFMTLWMGGDLVRWVIGGVYWAIFMWITFSILFLILLRDIVIRIPINKNAALDKQLAEAVKRLRYTVEQQSSTDFVCKPKSWLPRLLEMNRVEVHVMDDGVELAGPATTVKKVRKKLLRS